MCLKEQELTKQTLFAEDVSTNLNIRPPREYLLQFYLTYVENPSDDSDFEETSLEFDEDVKNIKLKRKEMEKNIQEKREDFFANCFKQIDNFLRKLEGLEFKIFNHEKIKFVIKPYELDCDFYHPSEKFVISINFDEVHNRWFLGRIDTGEKDKVIKVFEKEVNDENIFKKIQEIYEIISDEIIETSEARRKKFRIISNGGIVDDEIFLLPIEEKILLSREKLVEVREKRAKIHERMRWPLDKEQEIMSERNQLPCNLFG